PGPERLGQEARLGRLAAAVDAFEGDQAARHGHGQSPEPWGSAPSAPAPSAAAADADADFFAAAFFAPVFFAAAFLVAGAFFAAVFLAGAFFAPRARLAGGPAARRSARSSAARSMVIVSGSS